MAPTPFDRSITFLRETLRWAWIQDETDHTASRRSIAFTATLYVVAFVAFLVVGAIFWRFDNALLAQTFWIFGGGFASFAGAIAVGWEVMNYLDRTGDSEAAETPSGPSRELAPDFHLSNDLKFGFVVTIVAFVALFGYLYVFTLVLTNWPF